MGVVRGSRKANPEKKRKFEKKTIPIGIRVLINYSIIVGFFYLLFGIVFPATTIFGKQAEGYYVSITNILIFLLAILMIIGFYKKKYWSWKLALVLYSFSIFNSFIILFLIRYSLLDSISGFISSSFIIACFINLLTIWYLFERKDYFTTADYHPSIHMSDKVFISSIYIVYFFAIIFVIALGFEYYKSATFTVDSIIEDLNGMTLQESISYCHKQESRAEDVCYLTIVTMHHEFKEINKVCEYIRSDFYKLACYQASI